MRKWNGTSCRHSLRVDGIADTPLRAELPKRKLVKTFQSEPVAVAKIHEDIPIWAELWKRKFVKTFLFERSYGSGNSWRHSYLSIVTEAEIREDIPIKAEWRKRKFLKTFPITVELRKFVKTFLSERSYRSGNSWRHSYLSGVTEAEIREDIPIWAELRKRKFVKTFLSELSYGSRNSWRHSYLSGVTEIREDISIWAELRKRKFVKTFLSEQSYRSGNLWRLSYPSRVTEAEIREDIPIWAEWRKRKFLKTFPKTAELWNFVKTFLSEQSYGSGNSWRHSYLSRVAEAEIREDIPIWAEWLKRKFTKTFPITVELRKFVKTFLSERSYRSGNSWRHSYLSGVTEAEIREDIPIWAKLLKQKFVKTFLSERSYRNSWRHFYLSRVTEEEIREDIPIWAELRKRKFMKTFLSEQSDGSRNLWRHSP